MAVLVFVAAIYALIAMVVPNIIDSIEELLQPAKLQGYYDTINHWVHKTFTDTEAEAWAGGVLESIWTSLQGAIQNVDFPSLISDVFSAGVSVVSSLFNFGVGVIAAVYILIYKKQLCVQAKKLTVSVFRADHADRLFEIARRTNRIFSGYVIGKIIDAIFVGVVTYLALIIMNMP